MRHPTSTVRAALWLVCGLIAWQRAGAVDPPLVWIPPASFDAKKPRLGLPELPGAKHSILFAPKPAQPGETNGYASLRHGLYNHHQQFLLHGNKVIVYWTNHLQDENGPGQRLLAKVGTLTNEGADIDWGGDETLLELAPPAMPATRRLADNGQDEINSAFLDGELTLSGGKLYLRGRLQACHGWTDDMRFHNSPLRQPVPEEHYCGGLDKKNGFRWDLYWFLGSFVQQWDFVGGRLVATSPIYFLADMPVFLQVTSALRKEVAPLNAPYLNAPLLKHAPSDIQNFIAQANRNRAPWQGHPRYAEGMFKRAANGKDGLAHWTEFRRPGGEWVVVRDNLLDAEVYYASVRASTSDTYPAGIRTNLFGTAMPVAGNLPDGSAWIVGGNRDRTDMYLTWSKDGITFDRSWSLVHQRMKVTEGVSKTGYGGPQYFKALTLADSLWIVYSIGKENMGLTRIPFSALSHPSPR